VRNKDQKIIDEAFHQVIGQSPPAIKHTRRKKGEKAARKMEIAKALDLARERGANVPKK